MRLEIGQFSGDLFGGTAHRIEFGLGVFRHSVDIIEGRRERLCEIAGQSWRGEPEWQDRDFQRDGAEQRPVQTEFQPADVIARRGVFRSVDGDEELARHAFVQIERLQRLRVADVVVVADRIASIPSRTGGGLPSMDATRRHAVHAAELDILVARREIHRDEIRIVDEQFGHELGRFVGGVDATIPCRASLIPALHVLKIDGGCGDDGAGGACGLLRHDDANVSEVFRRGVQCHGAWIVFAGRERDMQLFGRRRLFVELLVRQDHSVAQRRRDRIDFQQVLENLFVFKLFRDFRQRFCEERLDLRFAQGVVEPPQIRDIAVERIPMVRRLSDDQSAASGLVADRRELSLVFALPDTVHVGYNLLFFNGEGCDDMHPVVAEDAGGAGEIRFAVGQAIMVQQLAFRREAELLAPAAAVKRCDVAMLVHVPHGHFRHAEPQRRGEFRQVVHGRACQRDAVFMRRKPVVCIVIRSDAVQRDAIFRRVQAIHFRVVEQNAPFVPP